MYMLHKNSNISSSLLTLEGGQREFLCSNNKLDRCSPLGVFSNEILNKENKNSFIELAKSLKQIHTRLLIEGYTIKDGIIYKP